jgi:phage tail sheath protein FI
MLREAHMPEYVAPGTHVEETPKLPPVVPALPFHYAVIGIAPGGPVNEAIEVASAADADGMFGGTDGLCEAARSFFTNGGQRLWLIRLADMTPDSLMAALAALPDDASPITIAVPGARLKVAEALANWASEPNTYRFAVIDPPQGATIDEVRAFRSRFNTPHAALYYPWVMSSADGVQPPSAAVLGVYARVDAMRGVHKAPANEALQHVVGTETRITQEAQEVLNPLGINALRTFPGRGTLVWGARTLSDDPEWRYVNVRRTMSWLEVCLSRGMPWIPFEPNDEALWAKVRTCVYSFLQDRWREGMFQGGRPEDAYLVRCDRSTMSQNDIDNGRLVCLVGAALVKPAEFVMFKVGAWTGSRPGLL